ncbi:hypothetical protein SAMN05421679_104335 [Epilithonimonas pallida]|uniref:HIRAN domain-containing protein n=1 Tax=Epilithonimonas pallida TaxID=373671 RepID=A0ABY1R2E1_9FLAO|nr:hypothetical protein SAMN05421679_104335 [Epilithonimonas pallida]
MTEYYKEGILYGKTIKAPSWDEAQIIVNMRGLGEIVIGYVPV